MEKLTLKPIQTLAVTALLVTATVVKAEVYKCTGADGKTAFSDQPCLSGQKAAVIKPQISSAPAVLTDEQKKKGYDKIVELTAKKLEDPKFKEQCRVARQRMAEIGKDKTGQTRVEERSSIKTQLQECDARLGEYIGSELARAEHDNKLEAKKNAAEAAQQAIADEPKRLQKEADCKELQRNYAENRALASKFRGQQKPGDWPDAEVIRYENAYMKSCAEMSKRNCLQE
jgi:Domain of unknown function (DUF4124)